MSESKRPTCETCPFYDAEAQVEVYPKPPSGYQGTMLSAIHVLPATMRGLCKRDAVTQPHRKPEEWCGQHPDFAAFLQARSNQTQQEADRGYVPTKVWTEEEFIEHIRGVVEDWRKTETKHRIFMENIEAWHALVRQTIPLIPQIALDHWAVSVFARFGDRSPYTAFVLDNKQTEVRAHLKELIRQLATNETK